MDYQTSDIAVVIPAYNCEATIESALKCVFAQVGLPGEVIVVNDGSQDSTEAVLKQSVYWPKIKYIYQHNAGPAVARNTGVFSSNKEWIAFLDADDIWVLEDKLQRQIALANANPNTTLVDSYARVDWHGVKTIVISRKKAGDSFSQFLVKNAVNATSSVLARRSTILQAGGFKPQLKFGEDRLLWAQLALVGEVHTLTEVAIFKCNQVGNLTSKGLDNYRYRIALVHELLALRHFSEQAQRKIWTDNFFEFLNLAKSINCPGMFLQIYQDCRKLGGSNIIRSRYFVWAIYARLFNTFKPFVNRKLTK